MAQDPNRFQEQVDEIKELFNSVYKDKKVFSRDVRFALIFGIINLELMGKELSQPMDKKQFSIQIREFNLLKHKLYKYLIGLKNGKNKYKGKGVSQ